MLLRSRVLLLVTLAACQIPPELRFSDGTPGMATQLIFGVQPVAGTTEQPLAAITIVIADDAGTPVARNQAVITLALRDNPSGAHLLGEVVVAAIGGGAARFTFFGVDRPGRGYTLEASAPGLRSAISAPFDVAAPAFMPVSMGLDGGPLTGVAVTPAPPGGTATVLVAARNGAYRSVDHGATWTRASFGLWSGAGTLVADPGQPGVAYAVKGVTGYGFVGGPSYFARKTRDGGISWFNAGAAGEASSVAVDATNSSILYAGGFQLSRSTDGGATWKPVSGFPLECPGVAVDAVVPTTIYCTAYDRATFTWRGVYRSTDDGATWAASNEGLTSLVTSGLLLATPEAVFVASDRLYRSADHGASWTAILAGRVALAHAPSLPARMYVGQGGGVSVSTDGGASFGAPVSFGDSVQSLAVDPTDPDLVYAAGENGVHVSADGGARWSFSSSGIAARPVQSVAMAPSAPDTVLVTTPFFPSSSTIGVFRTGNGGTSWTRVATTTGIVRFDPGNATRAYLCGDSFAVSTDSGLSFEQRGATGTSCAQLALAMPAFLAAGQPGGTRKSVDGGVTWDATGLMTTTTYSVALADGAGDTIIVGSNEGIWRSVDGGASFARVSLDLAGSILADPTTPGRVIAGLACGAASGGAASNGGFRISTDGGATFGKVIPGPCVAQLGDNGTALYAAGRNESAFSTDHGETWTRIASHAGVEATSIAASADGATIYIGTIGGLYRSTSATRRP